MRRMYRSLPILLTLFLLITLSPAQINLGQAGDIATRLVLGSSSLSNSTNNAGWMQALQKCDEDSGQLRAALDGNTARIIITTLQKFPVVAEKAGSVAGSRFAVIVDEAHSSTSGEAIKDMKRVLGASPTFALSEVSRDGSTMAYAPWRSIGHRHAGSVTMFP